MVELGIHIVVSSVLCLSAASVDMVTPSLHYGFTTAHFSGIIPGFNVSILWVYCGAFEILYFSGKFEAIQNYGNGELQRLMMRTLTGLNSSIQTNLNT